MCIERLWPYWLLHWRTQYYGLLTIIALYIGYLITFGCYHKAKWSVVYLWKGTTQCLVNVFMGNPRKGGVNVKVWGKTYVQLHDRVKLRSWFFWGNEGVFYWQEHSENELLQWHSCECNSVGVLSFIPFPSCLITVFCVHCKQLYPALHILLQFASLHFSLFIVYCFFGILYKSYISLVL